MKIIVDKLPEESEKCLFSEKIEFTGKRACMFRSGLYSRCLLEMNEKCPYLLEYNRTLRMPL